MTLSRNRIINDANVLCFPFDEVGVNATDVVSGIVATGHCWIDQGFFVMQKKFANNGDFLKVNHYNTMNFDTGEIDVWIHIRTLNTSGTVLYKHEQFKLEVISGVVKGSLYNGSSWQTVSSTGSLEIDKVYRATYQLSSSYHSLYINGQLHESITPVGFIQYTSNPLLIGVTQIGSTRSNCLQGGIHLLKINSNSQYVAPPLQNSQTYNTESTENRINRENGQLNSLNPSENLLDLEQLYFDMSSGSAWHVCRASKNYFEQTINKLVGDSNGGKLTRVGYLVNNKIPFVSGNSTNYQIMSYDLSNDNKTILVTGTSILRNPVFSWDYQKLCYVQFDSSTGRIYMSDVNGQNPTGIVTGSASKGDFFPEFSENSNEILFERWYPTADHNLYKYDISGNTLTLILSGSSSIDYYSPTYFKDFSKIAFYANSSTGNIQIWSSTISGTSLINSGKINFTNYYGLSASSDNNKFYYVEDDFGVFYRGLFNRTDGEEYGIDGEEVVSNNNNEYYFGNIRAIDTTI